MSLSEVGLYDVAWMGESQISTCCFSTIVNKLLNMNDKGAPQPLAARKGLHSCLSIHSLNLSASMSFCLLHWFPRIHGLFSVKRLFEALDD